MTSRHKTTTRFALQPLAVSQVRGAFQPVASDSAEMLLKSAEVRSGQLGDILEQPTAPGGTQTRLIQADGLHLIVAGATFQFELSVPEDLRDNPQEAIKYSRIRLNRLVRKLKPIGLAQADWAGVICRFRRSIDGAASATDAIVSWLKSTKSHMLVAEPLISFGAQVGFKDEKYNVHLQCQGYSLQTAQAEGGGDIVVLDDLIEKLRVQDAGVEFLIDINDKPLKRKGNVGTKINRITDHLVANYQTWLEKYTRAFGD